MTSKHDEQKLLDAYRGLTSEGKAELLDYADFLMKKYQAPAGGEATSPDNQCQLEKPEERPEAAKEPIFTE